MSDIALNSLPSEAERTPTREEVVAHGTVIYEVEELLDSDITLLASIIAEKSGAYVFYDTHVDFKGLAIFSLIAVGDQIKQTRARLVAQELSSVVVQDMLQRSRLVRMYRSSHIALGWVQ